MANPKQPPKRRSGGQPPKTAVGNEPASEPSPPTEGADNIGHAATRDGDVPADITQQEDAGVPSGGFVASADPPQPHSNSPEGETFMPENHDEKVYPSGLTMAEAEELHKYLWQGTKIFGAVSLVAHLLTYASSPWLH